MMLEENLGELQNAFQESKPLSFNLHWSKRYIKHRSCCVAASFDGVFDDRVVVTTHHVYDVPDGTYPKANKITANSFLEIKKWSDQVYMKMSAMIQLLSGRQRGSIPSFGRILA